MAARFTTTAAISNSAAFARIQARLKGVSQAKLKQAAQRTLASTRRKVEPIAKRVVREGFGVKPSALSGVFDVKQGREGDSEFIALRATVSKISLINFGGRWGGRKTAGAVASITGGQAKTYTSAFITKFANGAKQIVARKLLSGGRRTARLPLVTLKGPSAYDMVQGTNQVNAKRITEELVTFAQGEAQRQIGLVLKGKL